MKTYTLDNMGQSEAVWSIEESSRSPGLIITKWPCTFAFEKRKFNWNYYLYIPREWISKRLIKKYDKPERGLDVEALFADIYWHGGITYSQLECIDGIHEYFKVGCDFQHGFEMAKEYTLAEVLAEARRTIKSFKKSGILK